MSTILNRGRVPKRAEAGGIGHWLHARGVRGSGRVRARNPDATMAVREYDPDADPLMGRLVSVRVDESAGGRWEDALVGYCETSIVANEEVSTGLYRVLWGSFKSVDEALATKRKHQKVRRATPPLAPRAPRARVGTFPESRRATLRLPISALP